MKGELSFVQISDCHMGFNKPANPDVAATLRVAVDKINALPTAPEFMSHTGDISHNQPSIEVGRVRHGESDPEGGEAAGCFLRTGRARKRDP